MAGSEASDTAHHLVQRLTPSLRRFARALAGDAVLADEIVRSALGRLLPRSASGPHLKAALYAGVVMAHRARRAPPAEADNGPRPVRTEIVQHIERLPLDQREVLLLVVLEQLTYDEAATILSLPRSSIVARLARARAALAMAGEEPGARPAYLRLVK